VFLSNLKLDNQMHSDELGYSRTSKTGTVDCSDALAELNSDVYTACPCLVGPYLDLLNRG